VVWHVPGHSSIAGEHRGRDEVLRYFAERRTLTNAIFRIAEGKIAECWVVPHDQGAYDEIWSAAVLAEQ
jgi:hypothetical protein